MISGTNNPFCLSPAALKNRGARQQKAVFGDKLVTKGTP